MSDVRFYHLQRRTLEQALPQLLLKVLEKGHRVVVLAGSVDRVEALSQHLWSFDQASFLPHGSARDGYAEDQPVWLTADEENPNGADILVCVDGITPERPEGFRIICDLFDGNDPAAVEAARVRWRSFKAGSHALTYWQQTAAGGWSRKA